MEAYRLKAKEALRISEDTRKNYISEVYSNIRKVAESGDLTLNTDDIIFSNGNKFEDLSFNAQRSILDQLSEDGYMASTTSVSWM